MCCRVCTGINLTLIVSIILMFWALLSMSDKGFPIVIIGGLRKQQLTVHLFSLMIPDYMRVE